MGEAENRQVFRTFWHGRALSLYERACLSSFVIRGFEVELWAYDDVAVPAGVRRMDARAILPQSRLDGFVHGIAAFSDLFRYRLLARRGGWWIDTDVVCLRGDIGFPTPFYAWQGADLVNNAVLRLRRGSPLARALVERAEAVLAAAEAPLHWGAIGPNLLTDLLRNRHGLHRARPAAVAYPIDWQDAAMVLDPAARDAVAAAVGDAAFLHLWNEILRREGVDKSRPPPAGSYLAGLFEAIAAAG